MVSIQDLSESPEFQSDYEFFETVENHSNELDLTFLETIDEAESLFAINTSYFRALDILKPEPAFIPSLHSSIFEKPIPHALWTSNSWPETKKHFPA